jgi:hypothetical protein
MPMTDEERAIADLPAQSVGRTLDWLVQLKARELGGEKLRVPFVTLHLRSGRDIFGQILKLSTGPGVDIHALLHSQGTDPRNPVHDAVFVLTSLIEAVTVHDVPSLALAPPGAAPIPTKVALRRKAEAAAAEIGNLLGIAITFTLVIDGVEGEPLRGVDEAIDAATDALRALASSGLKPEAMQKGVSAVEFGSGPSGGIQRLGQTLRVTAGTTPASRLSKEQVRKALEGLL